MMRFEEGYPELLADIAERVREACVELGVDAAVAEKAARDAAEAIGASWGGIEVYIPQGLAYRNAQRNLEIWQKFNGCNTKQLARDYGLTDRQVTNIIRRIREEERRKRQPDFFAQPTK